MTKYRIWKCSPENVATGHKDWGGRGGEMDSNYARVLPPYDLRHKVNWRAAFPQHQANPDLPEPWLWGNRAARLCTFACWTHCLCTSSMVGPLGPLRTRGVLPEFLGSQARPTEHGRQGGTTGHRPHHHMAMTAHEGSSEGYGAHGQRVELTKGGQRLVWSCRAAEGRWDSDPR